MAIDTIKKDSTFPYLEFFFKDKNNEPVDCTPFEVTITIKNERTNAILNSCIVGGLDSPAVWIDEALGKGEYRWQETDTSVRGNYIYEFMLIRSIDGEKFFVPKDGQLTYRVEDNVETA